MGLFDRKERSPSVAAEAPPAISPADIADATAMMDRWDRAMGNNDAMWSCIEAIARLGGFRGPEAAFDEAAAGRDAQDVLDRPWRWWTAASRAALSAGDNVLPGRIFLFTYLFINQILPGMNAVTQLETGLSGPETRSYQYIARQAIQAMEQLAPSMLIHDTRTGKVDVASALKMAYSVTGASPASR